MQNLKLRTFAPLLLLSILAGCGGGGTSSSLQDTPNPIVATQVADITPANTDETVSVFVALDASGTTAAGTSSISQSLDEQRTAQQDYFLKALQDNVTPSLQAADSTNTCSSSDLATRIHDAHSPQSGHAVRIDLNACELNLLPRIKGVAGVHADIPMSVHGSSPSGIVDKSNTLSAIKQSFNGITAQPSINTGTGPVTVNGTGQVIAILDTGVEERHPALGNSKVFQGACFSTGSNGGNSLCPNKQNTDKSSSTAGRSCADTWNGSRDAAIAAGCSHGTAMAAAASMNYATSGNAAVNGTAPAAQVLPVQVFNQNGKTLSASAGDLLAAVEWLTAEAQRRRNNKQPLIVAMNMSLGGGSYTAACDSNYVGSLFKTAFANLRAQGVLPIVATGNAGLKNAISFPACVSNAVSVSAAKLSYNGLASYANVSSQTKLIAIGGDVDGSGRYALPVLCSAAGAYDCWDNVAGTSPATALVSGGVAALYSAKPNATLAEIETALTSTASSASTITLTAGNPAVSRPALRLTASAYRLLNTAEPAENTPTPTPTPTPVPTEPTQAQICVFSQPNYSGSKACAIQEYGMYGEDLFYMFLGRIGSVRITDLNGTDLPSGKASVTLYSAFNGRGTSSGTVKISTPDTTRLTRANNPIIRIVEINTALWN